MKYLEWNNVISEYFFKPENAGEDVYLYITTKDIIDLGRKKIAGKKDYEILSDFLNQLRAGLPEASHRSFDIIDNAKEALILHKMWLKNGNNCIDGIKLFYPPYIAYLVFFVLPLIEIQGDYNANNYFDRLDLFVNKHYLKQNLRNRLNEIDALWLDLSKWANTVNNGEYGFFQTRHYVNKKWIYVAKPFSQCLLPPFAIRNFPKFFLEASMVPGSTYPDSDFKKYLMHYGKSILSLSNEVTNIIAKCDTDELGQSIIDIAKKEYDKWTGEVIEQVLVNDTLIQKKNYTVSSLLMQFKVNNITELARFSFRLYSKNEFPEDLEFNSIKVNYERIGFSKTIDLPLKESFILRDDFNKWQAVFPKKDVRLFSPAGIFQLSTDYWIEVDMLSKTDWMYLLCTNHIKNLIVTWGQHFKQGNFIEKDLDGLPANYSLFKIKNPIKSLDAIPLLKIYSEKYIILVNGLKTSFRTYAIDYLPDVEVINSDGDEQVNLRYNNSDKDIPLLYEANSRHWKLPLDIECGRDFKINLFGEDLISNELTYEIVSTIKASSIITNIELPKRDKYGRICKNLSGHFAFGNKISEIDVLSQIRDKHLFRGNKGYSNSANLNTPAYEHHEGNILLSLLSFKNICDTEDFYMAFEFLHTKYTSRIKCAADINFAQIKKASLIFYDSLGYIDYEYEEKSIIANPTCIILMPADEGRKALLIGARDEETVNKLIEIAPMHKLQIEITKQENNKQLLLPDAITLKPINGISQKEYGEKYLTEFAQEINIPFIPDDLIQVSFLQYSARISEYENDLFLNNETKQIDYPWARKIFNPNTLLYDMAVSESFDKTFALVEYKFNEYTYLYKLWKDNRCYSVDKAWGNYLALWHFKKQVILYDECKKTLAIPIELPLPKLLAKSIILLCGLAPSFLTINNMKYRLYANIPYIFAHNLFLKLGQQPIKVSL